MVIKVNNLLKILPNIDLKEKDFSNILITNIREIAFIKEIAIFWMIEYLSLKIIDIPKE